VEDPETVLIRGIWIRDVDADILSFPFSPSAIRENGGKCEASVATVSTSSTLHSSPSLHPSSTLRMGG
jgi:hypothetical protein